MWKKRWKQIFARILAVAVLAGCMPGARFPAYAESYGKDGSVRDLTSWQIIEDMGLGCNIGRSLDCLGGWAVAEDPWGYQWSWGNPPLERSFIQKVKEKGFRTIRLPVSWALWMDDNGQINPAYMKTVQEIIDWCLEEDLYVILTMYQDGGTEDFSWIRGIATDFQGVSGKYARVWAQIAANFASYGDHLLFEGLGAVEFPEAESVSRQYELLNHLNQLFVDTVRGAGGNNPGRHLLVPGFACDIERTCDGRYQMPEDPAGRCILTVNYYAPWLFCVAKESMTWVTAQNTWGSEDDVAAVYADLSVLADRFLSKGVPVVIGEYGVVTTDRKEEASIRSYLGTVSRIMLEYGMCPILMDTGLSGDTRFLERYSGEFYDPQLAAVYQELAGQKAQGQIEKIDVSVPFYSQVTLPVSPGGWVSLASFDPSKILGIRFRLSSESGWDGGGGGGIWIDGYDNTIPFQFSTISGEITCRFSREERKRIEDKLGLFVWWTSDSSQWVSVENSQVTVLYAGGTPVNLAGPYTNLEKEANGRSASPNNHTEPAGSGHYAKAR